MVSIGNFTERELPSYNQYYVNTAQCTEDSFTISWPGERGHKMRQLGVKITISFKRAN